MAGSYDSLVAAIDRIVTSPYPTQLKGLRDLVCTRCASGDIARWALAKPCQIRRLANCLLTGLRQWPYVLELITRLSIEPVIRDALLEECPSLLNHIIDQAVKASSKDSRYVLAAVVFLSNTLPEHLPLPAEAQTLFVRLFDLAADEPSLPNIRNVYEMLRGTSSLLLGLLSSSSLLRLEQHLFDIIRNVKGENQSLSLCCLAIMRILCSSMKAELRLSNSQYDTQELLASTDLASSSKWSSDSMQQFFTDGKSQRTVQLVVLRAMWACTTSTGEPFDERLESLVLANEVISAIAPYLRETWRKANSLIVGKLQDKIMSAALEPELKFQGLCFLAQVSEGSRVPVTVIDGLRHFAVDPRRLQQTLSSTPQTQLNYLLDAGVFDETTLTDLLQRAVNYAIASDQDDWLESTACLQAVLSQIFLGMPSDSKLSEGTMLALDVITCGEKLRRLSGLIAQPAISANTSSGQACGQAMHGARRSLVNVLCKVFLRAALSAPHQSFSASQDTVTLLLELHSMSGPSIGRCDHANPSKTARSSGDLLIEAFSTQDAAPIDWREAVRHHADSRALVDADQLMKIFSKACADLEARCEDIEAPLREEQRRCEALQRRYSNLEDRYASLEAESSDRSVQFHAIEMERDQAINDLEAQREEIDGHERRIEELLLAVQQARESSEEEQRNAKYNIEKVDMEHAAAAARKDEEAEELQDRLTTAEREVQDGEARIKALGKDNARLQQQLSQIQSELQDAKHLGAEHQSAIADIQREKQAIKCQVDDLSAKLKAASDDAVAQREAFERDLNDLKQRSEDDFATKCTEDERRLAELTRSYEENADELRRQLAEVHDEVDQARQQHRADIEQWEAEIGERQKKVCAVSHYDRLILANVHWIDRLSRKCTEKDKQIAEANSMRTNLMAAMGLGGMQSNAQAAQLRPSRASTTQRTQTQHADSQDDPSPPTPFSGDDSQQADGAEVSFNSNATSSGESRSGPTPKRPRPRRSIKTHSPAKMASRLSTKTRSGARASLAPQAGKSTVRVRQPLLGVSGNQNRLPVRPSLKSPSKHVQEEEDMFDGSEIFAGTQELGLTDLGAALDEETATGL